MLAYNDNVHFLNTFLSGPLSTVLYLRTSLAHVCNHPVTTNFISCSPPSELVLVILSPVISLDTQISESKDRMFNFTGNVDITTRHFMQEAEHWLWERYGQHSSPWT